MIRCLHIFDFDATLFRSPEPPEWWRGSHDDWWHKIISLVPPGLPKRPSDDWWVESTVAAVKAALKVDGNHVVLLTGRPAAVFTKRVHELLRQKGLTFDEVRLSDQLNTQAFKAGEIRKLLDENPDVEHVDLWDDMADMVPTYQAVVEEDGVGFEFHLVNVEARKSPCTEDEFLTGKVASRYNHSV